MTENLFNVKRLANNLNFMYPDFAWIMYHDHVYSNYDGLDMSISIYHRDGIETAQFLVNFKDSRFKLNDRDVVLFNNFDQLCKKITSFENMHKIKTESQIEWTEVLFGSKACALDHKKS